MLPQEAEEGQLFNQVCGGVGHMESLTLTLLPALLFLARFCAPLSQLTCPLHSQHELQPVAEHVEVYDT